MRCLGREDGGKLIDPAEHTVSVPGLLSVDPLVRISIQKPSNHAIRLCKHLSLSLDINSDCQKTPKSIPPSITAERFW